MSEGGEERGASPRHGVVRIRRGDIIVLKRSAAGVVLASASTQIGVAVTASRSWTDGFSYALTVPSGQRRAMQLFQQSRSFYVTKKTLRYPCYYVTAYSGQSANAPRVDREDEWMLVP